MTITDLKRSIVGVVITNMEQYDSKNFTIKHGEYLFNSIKDDMQKMFDRWWCTHFPFMKFTVSVQVHSGKEPGVVMNWHHDTESTEDWERLFFVFNPVRLSGRDDPIAAYQRAMAII